MGTAAVDSGIRFVNADNVPVYQNQRVIGHLARGTPVKVWRAEGDWVAVTPTENWTKGAVWVWRAQLKQVTPSGSALTKQGEPRGPGKCWATFKYLHDLPADARVGEAKYAGRTLLRLGWHYVGDNLRVAEPGMALVFPGLGNTGHIATYLGNGRMRDNHGIRAVPDNYRVEIYTR